MQAVYAVLAIGFAILVYVISTVNRLTRLRNLVRESWSQVDVALKRRYDLIPNLVETVKAFAAHERDTLDRVISARNQIATSATGGARVREESALVAALNGLLVRAEAYPQLRSSENFLKLQEELANTEDRIAAARRFYNANVRDYNIAQEQFPASLLASGHSPAEFFEIDDVAARNAPRLGL